MHNDSSIEELGRYLYSENKILKDLVFAHSGFMMNESLILDKYNDIKKIIDEALNNYRISGQGDFRLKK